MENTGFHIFRISSDLLYCLINIVVVVFLTL